MLGAVVLLFITLLGAAGLKSYRDLTGERARERQLETQIETTRAGIDHLRNRIDRLRGDPAMLERLAREDLGLVRPQDLVIELPAAAPAATAPPPPAVAAPAPNAAGGAAAEQVAPPPAAPASKPQSIGAPQNAPAGPRAPDGPSSPASSHSAPRALPGTAAAGVPSPAAKTSAPVAAFQHS